MARAWLWRPRAALVFALFVYLCVPSFPVRADHIGAGIGSKPVNYCARVTNIDQFPAYVFFLESLSSPIDIAQQIFPRDCIHPVYHDHYQYADLHFFAMRADAFDLAAYKVNQINYLKTTLGVVKAPEVIFPLGSVNTIDSRDAAEDMLRIVRVDDTVLEIAPESVRYTYTGGKTETRPYTTINQYPPPPDLALWYPILVPALALAGIISLIMRRRSGKVQAAHG